MYNTIFLNCNSQASIYIAKIFNQKGRLSAITYDSIAINKDRIVSSFPGIAAYDSYKLWGQIEVSTKALHKDMPIGLYQKAYYAVTKYIKNRENQGLGLDELSEDFIAIEIIKKAFRIFSDKNLTAIITLFGPANAFDVALYEIGKHYNCNFLGLRTTNNKGVYTVNRDASDTTESLIDLSGMTKKALSEKHTKNIYKYISNPTSRTHYTEKPPLDFNHKDIESYRRTLENLKLACKAKKKQLLSLPSSKRMILDKLTPRNSINSLFNCYDHRVAKASKIIVSNKIEDQLNYIEYLKSNSVSLLEKNKNDSVIILLMDYTPEIGRYPYGGNFYHYHNYIRAAKYIKDTHISFKGASIYFKEHPNMMSIQKLFHMHPRRKSFTDFMDFHEIKPIPHHYTLDVLSEFFKRILFVMGSSKGAIELLVKGNSVLTTCKPFWLRLPNTFYYSPISNNIYSCDGNQMIKAEIPQNAKSSPLTATQYELFANKYFFSLECTSKVDSSNNISIADLEKLANIYLYCSNTNI